MLGASRSDARCAGNRSKCARKSMARPCHAASARDYLPGATTTAKPNPSSGRAEHENSTEPRGGADSNRLLGQSARFPLTATLAVASAGSWPIASRL